MSTEPFGATADASPVARVLIVDDDVNLAKAMQRVLSHMGFDVNIAFNGQAALEEIEQRQYDVMVLDLQMASMDGLEVYRAARLSNSAPEAILHSAYLDVPTTVTAMRAGISEVLEKPVAARVLGDRIRELVGNRRRALVRPGTKPSDENAARLGRDAVSRLRGGSSSMQRLREQIGRVAEFADMSVLIEGPTGTGKELVAEAIHARTAPAEPFVSINCAAVPEHLFESELFGHDAGSFTNARGTRVGLFEEAGYGTVFLDEIGEMPPSLQPKLLRVLETRQFRRVGSNRSRRFYARIVSATNRVLEQQLGESLRADLYFRLAGYTIATPALKDRPEDIAVLARHFLDAFAERYGANRQEIDADAMETLVSYPWPGNVRELRSAVENASILSAAGPVTRLHVETALGTRAAYKAPSAEVPAVAGDFRNHGPAKAGERAPFSSLPDLERELILEAFVTSGRNLSRAARDLGIPRSTLRDKLRKYGAR